MSERQEPEEPVLPGIEGLGREADPPPELEDRIVAALRERSLIPAPGRRVRIWLAAAAAVAGLLAGWTLGRITRPAAPAAPTASPRFVLFLEPLSNAGSNESGEGRFGEAERVAEYKAWAARLRESGRDVSGEKLQASYRATGPVRPEPGASSDESVGGYFVISARDYDDALAIARDCPHARHGGTIVVRAIEPTG